MNYKYCEGCFFNHDCNGDCVYINHKEEKDELVTIKPNLQSVIRDIQRKEYIEAMKGTEYGWKARGKYRHIGCPSDLQFVQDSDLPHRTNCIMDCKECWEYVLKNKWGNK